MKYINYVIDIVCCDPYQYAIGYFIIKMGEEGLNLYCYPHECGGEPTLETQDHQH